MVTHIENYRDKGSLTRDRKQSKFGLATVMSLERFVEVLEVEPCKQIEEVMGVSLYEWTKGRLVIAPHGWSHVLIVPT